MLIKRLLERVLWLFIKHKTNRKLLLSHYENGKRWAVEVFTQGGQGCGKPTSLNVEK
jgi:hypothetical protein